MVINSNTPPGPGPAQLLTQLNQIRQRPPDYLLQSAQAYGDVVRFQIPGNLAYFINDPDDVQHVLQMNHRNYNKNTFQYNALSQITGRGLLTNNGGEGWLAKRRIAQPAFSSHALQGLAPVVVSATEAMLIRWERVLASESILDIDREMMQCALEVVARSLFGADLSGQAYRLTGAVMAALDYLIFQTRSLMMVPGWLPIRQNRDFKVAMREIEQVVTLLIGQRPREHPGHDLLGMLLGAKDEKGQPALSPEEVRNEVVTLLIAGHETVASSLTWTWYLLAQHPEARETLRQEVKVLLGGRLPEYADLENLAYTQQVYNEALRLYPPAWLITRRALAADVVGGYPVPSGTLMIVSPYTMHRRTDIWPAPEGFRPERFAPTEGQGRPKFAFIPFGGGPRLCIGNRFAYVEATIILAMVSRRYELLLPPGADVAMEALVTLRPKDGLEMIARPIHG